MEEAQVPVRIYGLFKLSSPFFLLAFPWRLIWWWWGWHLTTSDVARHEIELPAIWALNAGDVGSSWLHPRCHQGSLRWPLDIRVFLLPYAHRYWGDALVPRNYFGFSVILMPTKVRMPRDERASSSSCPRNHHRRNGVWSLLWPQVILHLYILLLAVIKYPCASFQMLGIVGPSSTRPQVCHHRRGTRLPSKAMLRTLVLLLLRVLMLVS